MGRGSLELAQALLRVALAWHIAGSSTPKDLWVNEVDASRVRVRARVRVRVRVRERARARARARARVIRLLSFTCIL